LKKASYIFAALLFVLLCAPLHAQSGAVNPDIGGGGGCVNSPENPTAILALVGSLGAGGSVAWRRFRARRRTEPDVR
jgi:XrtJ-associated TM-motif-TM protein